jgi:hypothetical protein
MYGGLLFEQEYRFCSGRSRWWQSPAGCATYRKAGRIQYLGMVQDGMAYYYYYAAIVLRNGEPESAATLYFPDRIEYMFPEIMNREPVTTGVDLKSENLSVFGIGLGASLTRVLAQAKVQGIAVSKRAPGKWPDTIAGHEIFGTLDNSDGAKVVTVMALDDVIYSITGAMRNRILFERLKQQLENEMHLKPDKQDRSYVYNVDAAGGAITIRMFDATANLHTSPLLIGFRDAKVSAVAKEEIKKYLATPNPGTAD